MKVVLDDISRGILESTNLNYVVKLPEMSDKQYDKLKHIMEHDGGY